MDELELVEKFFLRAVDEVQREEGARARERVRPSEDAAALKKSASDKYRGSAQALIGAQAPEPATGTRATPPPLRADAALTKQLRASIDRGPLALEQRRARSR